MIELNLSPKTVPSQIAFKVVFADILPRVWGRRNITCALAFLFLAFTFPYTAGARAAVDWALGLGGGDAKIGGIFSEQAQLKRTSTQLLLPRPHSHPRHSCKRQFVETHQIKSSRPIQKATLR